MLSRLILLILIFLICQSVYLVNEKYEKYKHEKYKTSKIKAT